MDGCRPHLSSDPVIKVLWEVEVGLCPVSYHLPEDLGLLGSREGSVGHPAWHHQGIPRVGADPLHLGHHCFLLFLLEHPESSPPRC